MAESSALSFSSFSCSISTFSPSRSKDTSSTTPTRLSSFLSKGNSLLYRRQRQSSLLLRCGARDSGAGDFIGDNSFGFYPWQFPITDGGDGGAIQWVPDDRVTLLTADGLVQIGGSMVPHRLSSSNKKQGRLKTSQRLQRFQESDYMDPNQGLCLGALFDIAATNGLDMGRRLCIFGFCRSIKMPSDVVEDIVLERGGVVCCSGAMPIDLVQCPIHLMTLKNFRN